MRLKAHAKINWALNITGTRPDGYHLLDMLVQRLALADEIELQANDDFQLTLSGLPGAPEGKDNLVIKAARALKEFAAYPGGAHISLHKAIPAQAGLGGGSADAAAVLNGLNQLWGTGLSTAQLAGIGARLGADVPLCLYGGLLRIQGIGEQVRRLQGGQVYHLLLLQPEKGLPTAEVFRRFDLEPDQKAADIAAAEAALASADLPAIQNACRNQLQPIAEKLDNDIRKASVALQAHGASFSQMTGSGSVVFGLFNTQDQAASAQQALRDKWPVCILTQTMAD